MYSFIVIDTQLVFVLDETRRGYNNPEDIDQHGNKIRDLAIVRCLHSNRGSDFNDTLKCLYFIGKGEFAELYRITKKNIDRIRESKDQELKEHLPHMEDMFRAMNTQITTWYSDASEGIQEPSTLRQALANADEDTRENEAEKIEQAIKNYDTAKISDLKSKKKSRNYQ